VALVRERTIPTENPPLVGEVSANFCTQLVSYYHTFDPENGGIMFLRNIDELLQEEQDVTLETTALSMAMGFVSTNAFEFKRVAD
jgi:hypothetical protein